MTLGQGDASWQEAILNLCPAERLHEKHRGDMWGLFREEPIPGRTTDEL